MSGKSKKKNKNSKNKSVTGSNEQNEPVKPGRIQTPIYAGKKSRCILIAAIVLIAAAVAFVFFISYPSQVEKSAREMNLLVISLDTTRADRIGAYGYTAAHTPNIDRLAAGGVLMENCYTPVPVTLPAHSSLFTGKYPIGHKARDNGMYILRPDEQTLAEIMKTRQYETFAVISSFVLLGKFGLNQGFDTYDDSLNSHKIYNNYTSEIPAPEVYRKYLTWFNKNYHKPFFAWIHLYDPHEPYRPPGRFGEMFDSTPSGRYDGEIAFTDEAVGKIVESLKAKNVLDNTLIVIVGDHGEAFGEHNEFGHGFFCYEEAIKVPLVIYNKRLFPDPVRVAQRVNIIDIMPTLLRLYDFQVPEEIQGTSFLNLIDGKSETEPRQFFFESIHGQNEMNWAPVIGLIDGHYKYISLPEPELYDLTVDAVEKENIYFKKNHLARAMDKKLMKTVARFAGVGGDSKREMTAGDRAQLKSLGYISSFSGTSRTVQDPKKGIILDNKIKKVFSIIGKGDFSQARERISQLEEEHPDIRLPVFFDMKYQLHLKQDDADGCISILKEALEKYPKIERFYILYAFKTFEKGDEALTVEICNKLLKLNGRFTRAYILLGEIREKKADIDGAVGFYRKALEIEPQNISLKLKFAELMLRKRDVHAALLVYDQLLERPEVSSNPSLLVKIGAANFGAGKLREAEKLLRKAIQIQPRGDFYYNYAILLAKMGKLEQAIENMKTALEKYAGDLNSQKINSGRSAIDLWSGRRNRSRQ